MSFGIVLYDTHLRKAVVIRIAELARRAQRIKCAVRKTFRDDPNVTNYGGLHNIEPLLCSAARAERTNRSLRARVRSSRSEVPIDCVVLRRRRDGGDPFQFHLYVLCRHDEPAVRAIELPADSRRLAGNNSKRHECFLQARPIVAFQNRYQGSVGTQSVERRARHGIDFQPLRRPDGRQPYPFGRTFGQTKRCWILQRPA